MELLANLGCGCARVPVVTQCVKALGIGGQSVAELCTTAGEGYVVRKRPKPPTKGGQKATRTPADASPYIREFSFARPMNHCCIQQVIAIGRVDDSEMFAAPGEWDLWSLLNSAPGCVRGIFDGGSGLVMNDTVRSILMFGLVAGVAYIHQRGVIHRDIAVANCFVGLIETGMYGPLIADFGMSAPWSEQSEAGACGRPEVLAPEILRRYLGNRVICGQRDVYAMGFVLAQVAEGRLKTLARVREVGDGVERDREEAEHIMNEMQAERQDKWFFEFRKALHRLGKCWDLISSALDEKPERRPTALELLRAARGGGFALPGTDLARLAAAEMRMCRGIAGVDGALPCRRVRTESPWA